MTLKRRLIVIVDKDDNEPEKTAKDCQANVSGLSCMGTLRAGNGILVSLAHDNFPVVLEASDYGVCALDIRDGGLSYFHYPAWYEMRELYAIPSLLDEDIGNYSQCLSE